MRRGLELLAPVALLLILLAAWEAACRLLAMDEATLLDYQDIGVLLLLRHAQFRIAEIPVAMNPRKHGASRVFRSWWTVARYMAETSILCLARWTRTPRMLISRRSRA